jgi:hypothetical protein
VSEHRTLSVTAVVAVVAAIVLVVVLTSGGSSGGLSESNVHPTYTGPLSGFKVRDPGDTEGTRAQIEGVLYNEAKAAGHERWAVGCQQSSPNEYSCQENNGVNPDGSPNVVQTVDVQVNTSDGSLIASCVSASGSNEPCTVGGP